MSQTERNSQYLPEGSIKDKSPSRISQAPGSIKNEDGPSPKEQYTEENDKISQKSLKSQKSQKSQKSEKPEE